MNEIFYTSELSPFGARLRLVAAFTGRQGYEIIPPPGGTGSAKMKAINPFGQVPTVSADGAILIESQALMEYFVETGPPTTLMPETPLARARVRGICRAHDNQVVTAMAPIFGQLRVPSPDAAVIADAFGQVHAKLAALATFFDATGFAVGPALSLADLAIIPFASLSQTLAARFSQTWPHAAIPRLAAWWAQVSGVDTVAAELARHREAMAKIFGKPA